MERLKNDGGKIVPRVGPIRREGPFESCIWDEYSLNCLTGSDWSVSLMPNSDLNSRQRTFTFRISRKVIRWVRRVEGRTVKDGAREER